MSELYIARNPSNGWQSTRSYTATQVAAMRRKPAYKGLVFTEIKPVAVPATLEKVTKSPRKDAGNNTDIGTSGANNGADPGGADIAD